MKKLASITALIACTILLTSLPAQAAKFEEGVEFAAINPPQLTSTGKKIEVVEMFWYGCPHCFQFEPYVKRWLQSKPANVEFVRIPAVFRPEWALHARAYYTAEVLDVVEKIHTPFFNATHEEKRPLNTMPQIEAFFVEHGVKTEDFRKVFNSFAVEQKVRKAIELSRAYQIGGVPAVIVNGKYRTDNGMSGGANKTFSVVDYLIKQERK